VAIRPARDEDGEALRDVSRQAVLDLGDEAVSIDPGPDYFGSSRLMGPEAYTYVVTFEDRPVGIHGGVTYPVRVDGQEGRWLLIAHSRLLPEYSGGGLWGRLNGAVYAHVPFQELSGSAAYVDPRNAKALRLGGAEHPWEVRPVRLLLDCALLAGPPAGRPAGPADLGHIVSVLNAFHGDEELYVPYTPERLTARLNHAPELYSVGDIWITERAVLGVWRAGQIRTRTRVDGRASSSRRAAVLDFGWLPGAEAEFEALVHAWCAVLAGEGYDHVGIFTSPSSPGFELLERRCSDREPYLLCAPGTEEPAGASKNGLYVDPVYF
jgi:hypothetical protein